jgi:hypothetical protein
LALGKVRRFLMLMRHNQRMNSDAQPHAYKSLWDNSEDDWSDAFLLQPIDDETFRLAMEDWDIWNRWARISQRPDHD